MGVFELWEEAKVSRDNPHKLGGNMQTLHRKAQSRMWIWTQAL